MITSIKTLMSLLREQKIDTRDRAGHGFGTGTPGFICG